MRFCGNCGKAVNDFVNHCPNCNSELPSIEQIARSPYQSSDSRQYSYPEHKMGRPTGITILSVLIGIGILVNTSDGLSNLTLVPALAIYSLGIVIFQIYVVYGLWNMKSWGAQAAIILYIINIGGAFVMAFIFPDIIIQTTMDSIDVPYGFTINEGVLEAAVRSTLMMSLVMAVIVGGIVIAYVNSKKKLFVN